ncbi:aminotransferase class V-fold PLP-dependent enzyme, partial [Streptomyces sp. b94]
TKQSGILTFRHADVDAATVMARLAEQRINVWKIVGHHTPIYMADRGVDTAVRVSAHYYNTPEEMDVFGRALREALGAGA